MLFYGFGSKKALLEDFASTALTDYSVVVINGYLPSINMKQVSFSLYAHCRISTVSCVLSYFHYRYEIDWRECLPRLGWVWAAGQGLCKLLVGGLSVSG